MKTFNLVLTKELFIETIDEIEKQFLHDRKCSDAFSVILHNDYTSGYDNHWVENQLVKLLKISMNDNHKDSWIDYYIWELDFGKKWKKGMITVKGKDFKLGNTSDLWKILNID